MYTSSHWETSFWSFCHGLGRTNSFTSTTCTSLLQEEVEEVEAKLEASEQQAQTQWQRTFARLCTPVFLEALVLTFLAGNVMLLHAFQLMHACIGRFACSAEEWLHVLAARCAGLYLISRIASLKTWFLESYMLHVLVRARVMLSTIRTGCVSATLYCGSEILASC